MMKPLLSPLRFSLVLLSAAVLFSIYKVRASGHCDGSYASANPAQDATDLYAFRSPDDTNTVTIIANFYPFQSPDGGLAQYQFSTDCRYEIHIKNSSTDTLDNIVYRFTFRRTDEDTNTFFNIRFGSRNLRTGYTCEKSVNGNPFLSIITGGTVPPPNIGLRSINSAIGLNIPTYEILVQNSVSQSAASEQVYCGPADDPYFADLAGMFDYENYRPEGNPVNAPKDAMARFNVQTIALRVPISLLQKDGLSVTGANTILDPNFVIGVWASVSRPQIRTTTSAGVSYAGNFVQVSRIGMPLACEQFIPGYRKDEYNQTNPLRDRKYAGYFSNPELALYMDASRFGNQVPAFKGIRVATASLGTYDFRNGRPGLYKLKGSSAVSGTVLDNAQYGNLFLPDSVSPRALDILPLFQTGFPNTPPYQLAVDKQGGPLSEGKPIVQNFLPVGGDMLRLNMAVPVTRRDDPAFSPYGLLEAARLALTDPAYANRGLQPVPNMDGFPNGRRLEDDVATINVRFVSGAFLAAIGLGYNDYSGASPSVLTPAFRRVLEFNAGPSRNDTSFRSAFPYVQSPWRGADYSRKSRF